MADFDLLGDGLRKVLLAGIGALATGYEKSSELVDELVKKGEITVEQGKALALDLSRRWKSGDTTGLDASTASLLKKLRQ